MPSDHKQPALRASVYARYSSDNQREASIEDQVRECRAFIERQGWAYQHAYTDRAMSGASTLRPGYQLLLEDARERQFDVVVAEALDRLSRDQEDVGGALQAPALRRRPHRHPGRGRDHRAACRPQGHDERAVPQGPRRQDAARPAGPGRGGQVRRRQLATATTSCTSSAPTACRSAASAASIRARPRSCARIFAEYAAGRSARRSRTPSTREGVAGPRRQDLGRVHDQRPRGARHRHPQQRAVHRPAGLEPAALRQGPGDRQARVAAERAATAGSSRRCRSCGSSTRSCGTGSRRARRRCAATPGPTCGFAPGPAPAALPALRAARVRRLRRPLHQDQRRPVRLRHGPQQGRRGATTSGTSAATGSRRRC